MEGEYRQIKNIDDFRAQHPDQLGTIIFID